MEKFNNASIYTLFIFFILLSNVNSYLQEEECPREKPILKSNECQSIYCTPEEFSENICTISNSLIKAQWLNNLHIFNEVNMGHISVSKNDKNELFISSHKVSDDFDKYLYGFNSEGDGLFYDKEKNKYTSFEIIDFPIREYAEYNNYVEIEGKGYLIGVPTDDDIYLIDYVNKTFIPFSATPKSKSADTIFKINNSEDMFFTAYIFCKDTFGKNCSLHFQSFKLNLTHLVRINNITNISTLLGTRINCFQNENGSIFCIYTKNEGTTEKAVLKHYISVINPTTFKFDHSIIIEQNFSNNLIFDETINLKKNLYIIAYSLDGKVIKILFKNITIMESSLYMITFRDFFSNIKEILINKDEKHKLNNGSFKRNSLCKINENKFAILLKDFSKDSSSSTSSILLIYIFTIFNNDQNINVRKYSIDFELYNKHITDDIRGYTLGNFFGIVLGLTYDRKTYNSRATFMTFGYINSTEQEIYDIKLKYNNSESKIVLSQYINEIENNLFGYEFIGVRIVDLPNEEYSGYFISNNTNKKIEKDNIIEINTELKFILSNNYKSDIYLIVFAGVVSEPSYEKMNEYAEELTEYPLNENISEKDYYEPKILIGRKMNYKFRLSNCYDSCSTCSELSDDENNQKCSKCRDGFYFKEGTNNCYDKIDTKYYFDENTKMFSPCYNDCLTCSNKGNSQMMNCLTCDFNLKYYNKSKNCLNCTKYVNYEQNECIDIIPDGYYLDDSELGTLGKCYYLCKTCTGGPYTKSNHYYMNCKTCLYKNSQFKPYYDGDCPDTPDGGEEDVPIDGKCSFNKPILKEGKCQSIYCTPEEFQNNICTIYNPIVKTQWLNKFHIFSEESTSSICLANDIISNDKLIFMAQSQEMGYTEKYLYGFYNNGSGIFYDKEKNVFNTNKKLTFSVSEKLIENLAYVEIDSNPYLLTTPIENNLYLINYNKEEKKEKKIDTSSYFSDKIILRQQQTRINNPEYLIDYIYCKNYDSDCYLMMKNFEASDGQINEITYLTSSVQIHYNSNLNCYKDDNNYIKCTYNKINQDSTISHVIGIFSSFSNNNMELLKEFELENNYDINPSFDSMIEWRNLIYIIGYSLSDNKNSIKILLKKIFNDVSTTVFRINDYISSIPSITINEDSLYNFAQGEAKKNSFYKISNDKFAMLVNNFRDNENSGIVIFIFSFYDSFSKINIRHYPINFKLYNTLVDGKLIGYNLNGVFGILVELASPSNSNLRKASFFTFGYVNATDDIPPMEGHDILFNGEKKIIVKNYFSEIENNLFGYEISFIRVVDVPDKNKAGYFTLNNEYSNLLKNDIITPEAKIVFYASKNPVQGNYSLVLASMLKEPNYYETMNSYCQKLESYPLDQNDTEKKFYEPKTYLGKQFSFNFHLEGTEEIICYENCQTCYNSSKNIEDQKCIECKQDYYKIFETDNCFKEIDMGYYLDKDKKLFMPCYQDCLSCDNARIDNNMNCLSCKTNLKYYQKSKNCLNCTKFVNFEQTECIEEVPEGYFIEDENLGTIGKCHELCKTCQKGEEELDGEIHMNCKVCKFNNSQYDSKIEGNCPDKQEEKKDEKEGEKEGENKNGGSSSYMWILYSSIIFIVVIIIVILIRKYFFIRKNEGEYSKLKDKEKNISMENTSGLGI